MALRCLVNLFKHPSSIYVLTQKRQFIIDNTSQFINSDNKNIRNAVITMYLNYSIQFLDKNDSEGRYQLVSALSDLFTKEKDEQNLLRVKTALKNLSIGDEDANDLIQSMGIQPNEL